MHSLRNRVIVVAALAVLWIIGSLMDFRQASAQGPGGPTGLNVNIAGPIPLPVSVSGSASVSGTVAVSNLPLPVQTTATTTVIADKTGSLAPNFVIGPLDTSALKTLRINVEALPLTCGGVCGQAIVYSNDTEIDVFQIADHPAVSRVYELPGTKVTMFLNGPFGGQVHVVVLGRSN